MACHPVTDLADLTLGHLRGVVGRTFRALDGDGRPVALELLSVTDMRPRRRLPPDAAPSAVDHDGVLVAVSALGLEGGTVPVGPRRIGLLFRGPDRPRLADGLHDLELPWLPLHGLHLSPLEPDPDSSQKGILYEAVID